MGCSTAAFSQRRICPRHDAVVPSTSTDRDEPVAGLRRNADDLDHDRDDRGGIGFASNTQQARDLAGLRISIMFCLNQILR